MAFLGALSSFLRLRRSSSWRIPALALDRQRAVSDYFALRRLFCPNGSNCRNIPPMNREWILRGEFSCGWLRSTAGNHLVHPTKLCHDSILITSTIKREKGRKPHEALRHRYPGAAAHFFHKTFDPASSGLGGRNTGHQCLHPYT